MPPVSWSRHLNESTGGIDRWSFFAPFKQESHFGTLDFNGKFSAWGIRHNVLVGTDYYWYKYLENDVFLDTPPHASPINIFNPVYGTITDQFKELPHDFEWGARQDWYGVFVQDQISFRKQLHLLAGFRYDHATTNQLRGFPAEKLESDKAEKFSPRVDWCDIMSHFHLPGTQA
ncbi:TonB-dependent receptor domain-containing protein [Nitrosomonas marina]|uniref:Iron complex outermembrane recepter protein n=1 Tax=Nitrosomonas marina TaxID=917 RepID=A0A1H8C495_9PROT|nr:TonB-dependent receptor [Nitrosomonas marina]SEM89991.1 iron complex outermembrane recepter protein [Nitrosomonas marina]